MPGEDYRARNMDMDKCVCSPADTLEKARPGLLGESQPRDGLLLTLAPTLGTFVSLNFTCRMKKCRCLTFDIQFNSMISCKIIS